MTNELLSRVLMLVLYVGLLWVVCTARPSTSPDHFDSEIVDGLQSLHHLDAWAQAESERIVAEERSRMGW